MRLALTHRPRRRWFLTSPLVVLLLAGCAPMPSLVVSAPTTPRWEDRMQSEFDDPASLGSSSGGAPGSVQFALPVEPGDRVVWAVCTGTDVLHLTVLTGAARAAEADIVCGATTRLPITIEPDANVSLLVADPDGTDPGGIGPSASWYVAINSPGWQPTAGREG